MFVVTIINNGVKTVINEPSTNTENRVSGTIKQGINTINSFTFTILPNNIGYNLIEPLKTIVTVLNIKTNKYEFIGRVLSPSNSMNSDGLVSKTFVCESELAYLLDTYQSYKEVHNLSVRGYLEKLIQVHNANTDANKQFVVGNVNVIDNNDSLYRYIAYDSTKKNIDDDLIGKLGGELQVRYENGTRYLDYLTEIGKVCTTEIRLAKNLQDIEQTLDVNGYCNRLIPLGTKLKSTDSEGNEVDTENRLTIESVNNGIRYIDDKESIAKYGVIQGQVIYDDVNDVKNLLTKGQRYLLNQRILISNKVNALDLSLIRIDIDSFEIGNYYPLVHEILGINDTVRIVEKSISIDSPHTSTITLGDLEKDIKQYNIQAKRGYEEARKMAEKANSKAIQVENYTKEEVYRVDGRVNALTVDVNDEFINVNKDLERVNDEFSNVYKKINDIQDNISTNNQMKVHFIKSSTNGDCILIQCDNGKNILIDSNEASVATENINYIKSQGVTNLDYIIVTHHHSDYSAGMPAIIDAFTTTNAKAYHRTPNWDRMDAIEFEWDTKGCHDRFVAKCNEKGISINTPKNRGRINVSESTYFEFYNVDTQDYSDYNNLSLCVLLVHKNTKYFFSGDITHFVQPFETNNLSKIDVYKVEHHAHVTTTDPGYLDKLNPSIAITTRVDSNIDNTSSTHGMLQLKYIPNFVQFDVGSSIVITGNGYTFNLNTSKHFLLKNQWFNMNQSGNWYYFKEDGSVAKNETININGVNYEFDKSGLCSNPNG